MSDNQSFNAVTGRWEDAVPLPFSFGLLPWIWLRLTGYRDPFGRKAQLFLPWQ